MGSSNSSAASAGKSGRASGLDCCIRRDDCTACCEVNSSLLGEDAFYREAFYDCNEGDRSHDKLFSAAREQARLKMRKGRVLAKYASFAVKQRVRNAKEGLSVCIAPSKGYGQLDRRPSPSQPLVDRHGNFSWLGTTIPEWNGRDLPETGEGPCWSRGGRGTGLKVRCGPDYVKNGKKAECLNSMYETLTCDAIKSSVRIENVIRNYLGGCLPEQPDLIGESDRGGGRAPEWTPDCPLPRIICINMMLPYATGLNPLYKDPGCSFVGLFHIKPETMNALKTKDPHPAIKLLQAFCAGPAGTPESVTGDANRSLFNRVRKGKKKDQQSGLLKAIAHCVNPEDVHVPDMFHTYNGKPVLIAKCGYVVKDPAGEWLEIGIDVRGFNVLARKMLCSFRGVLPRTKIHYGFVVQGVEDEELPEVLMCDMYMHGINIMDDPLFVEAAKQ